MASVNELFARLRSTGRKAFIPFLPAGDPHLEATGQLLDAVVEAGADMVEIGFPFSDPIADGAVIQASYTRALQRGVKMDGIFAAVPKWQQAHPETPLVGMVSYSLVFRMGVDRFVDRLQHAGFAGMIVPDLPLEEAAPLAQRAKDRGLALIQLVTPTTPRDRAERIVALSTGFVYVVSVAGITGERSELPPKLREQLSWLRSLTTLPLCVGFGISRPEHVAGLRDVADGVIVGSTLVRHLENTSDEIWPGTVEKIRGLVRDLRGVLDRKG